MKHKVYIDPNGIVKWNPIWDNWKTPSIGPSDFYDPDKINRINIAKSEAVPFEDQKHMVQMAINHFDTPFIPNDTFFDIEIDGRIEIVDGKARIITEPKPAESEEEMWMEAGSLLFGEMEEHRTISYVISKFKIERR